MAGNPLVPQGNLNRLRASVVYALLPTLNVTASDLAKEAITVAFENDAGLLIPTLTGGVTSPEPYQVTNISMHILKTQGLSASYKAQIESSTNVGDITLIPDTTTLPNYQIANCVLLGVNEMNFDGTQPGFVVRLKGLYYTNSKLFDL